MWNIMNSEIENVKKIKKNGKFFFLIFLSMVPDFCFTSMSLHVIKIDSKTSIRCKIKELENTSWSFEDIRKISQPTKGINHECFIYEYDYNKIVNMTYQDAIKYVTKEKTKQCEEFVATKRNEYWYLPESFPEEFGYYCNNRKYEIYSDCAASGFYILSCLIFVPFADIHGRKRILSMGCQMVYLTLFVKIMVAYYTIDPIGRAMLNFAYPALKYPTQAILYELSDDSLRPCAFMSGYAGIFLAFMLFTFLPAIYWKLGNLLTYSTVLLLPLLKWYLPESPFWLISQDYLSDAYYVTTTLNNSVQYNQRMFLFRNREKSPSNLINHFRKLKLLNRTAFYCMVAIASAVGVLSFNLFSKHKILYNIEPIWSEAISFCSGMLAIVLSSICCVYLIGSEILLIIFLFINGIFFIILCTIKLDVLLEFPNLFLLATTDFTTILVKVSYGYCIQKQFLTNYRCTLTAICGAVANLSLLILCGIRLGSIFAANAVTAVLSIICGVILIILLIKNKKDRDFKSSAKETPLASASDKSEGISKSWPF